MKIHEFWTLALLAGSSVAISSSSYAADCPKGDTRQEHHVGNFNFVTNSWVEESGKLLRYVSCVGNFDHDTDLLVTWHVAGPMGTYVPSDEVAIQPRMSNDLSPRPVTGCIKFGNVGDHTEAQFMGSAADEKENANANENPCLTTHASLSPQLAHPGVPLEGYKDGVRVFFPSNPDEPHDTMLEVDGVIGVTATYRDDGALGSPFKSYFSYTAQKYKDRLKGDPDSVRVRPVFVADSDVYKEAFLKSNDNETDVVLGSKGQIVFELPVDNDTAVPIGAYYQFISTDNRVLGTIPMPMFGSAR
ncbi:hypothetical protein [Mesorhizobium sp. B2-7-1]|uniref:hypothetical protein n=1 Tax=Mesorhizobium sp. B2-7-1 TaxID=2589909 RepID=UPI00112932DE|nr:hypothetical protein [Mesorhizobium sp. B2-7-1]TPJ72551.1 hypothetical protein FJ471_07070 [Mesorhizobium sp. B2-7-1]